MTYSLVKSSFNSLAIIATSLIIPTSFVQAATVTYTFNGTLDSGALNGESYSGSFSFDNSLLTGIDDEYLTISNLYFNFLGSDFSIADADNDPEAVFFDGEFLGLSYVVSNFDPSFSFIPGFFELDEASFAYTPVAGNSGFGSINYQVVPEPFTILGSLSALGFGAFFKRKLA